MKRRKYLLKGKKKIILAQLRAKNEVDKFRWDPNQ